jgi:eukaryotic-like serine/threonine-protein kinase
VTSENRVGEVLASKYRLEELLGSGGMGHVYRAVNLDVGRTVAIKVLRAEHAQNALVVDRFLREARAANLVRHSNVVDVLDIGREANGTPFIVQELLEGEDLAHLVERRGGKLPVDEVVDLLGPVIDAVAEAHAHGVIHRDLKPENVFLAKGKRGPIPKLLDFGISKVRAPDLCATEVGVMMGTPAYMPPEQVQGARDADARSDVWALGVMLFELLSGRMPFDARDAPALFVAIATKDAPTLLDIRAEVPPEISRVVARCLRRRPDERYPSAAELARDLRHVIAGTELEATGQRSIPPGVHGHIPELAIPPAPLAPTIALAGALANEEPASAPQRAAPAAAAKPAPAPPILPAAPSLPPPAARVAVVERRLELSSDLGQMHAVAPRRSPARTLAPKESLGADTSGLIGAAVVGLVVVLGVGLLMQVAHRPEGWAVARFVLQPGQTLEVVLHGFLALLAFGLGATYCWRGVRHWRGDIGGGPSHAMVDAVVAAAAFFCVIELLCAVNG